MDQLGRRANCMSCPTWSATARPFLKASAATTPSRAPPFSVFREHMHRLRQLRENLSHGFSLFRRRFRQRRHRTGAPQQTEFLLREADRAARLRRSRRQPAQLAHRRVHGLLDVGSLSRPRSPDQRRRRWRQFLDAHRAQYSAGHVQGRRQLHELAAHPHGSRISTATPKASRSIPAATSAKAPA